MELGKLILDYWKCSSVNDFTGFPFDEFFIEFKKKLGEKLASHGMLSFEEYLEQVKQYYNLDSLKDYTWKSEHTPLVYTTTDIIYSIFSP